MTWRLVPTLLLGVWTAASLWLGTDAGLSITALILTAYGGMLLLAIWLVRLVRWLVRGRRSSGMEPVATGRRVLRWVWEPATIVIVFVVVYYGLAFPTRFRLNRWALESYVQRVQGGDVPSQARVVGLFRVRETEVLPGGVVRMITTDCMFDDCGVVFSPRGRPPTIGEDSYYPLADGWWRWWRSW